jgi:thiamine pyrophosphate-dependent acetolactate synthase large subunit-like protein
LIVCVCGEGCLGISNMYILTFKQINPPIIFFFLSPCSPIIHSIT